MNKAIIVILVIIGLYTGLYIHALQNISVTDFTFEEINIHTEDYTVRGNIELNNDGIIPISYKQITYSIIFSNNIVAEGTVKQSSLAPKTTTEVPFTTTAEWIPSTSLLAAYIGGEQIPATMNGTIHTTLTTIPFQREVILNDYVELYAKNRIDSSIDSFNETLNQITGNAIGTIKSWFD